jgi:hypothetical protein
MQHLPKLLPINTDIARPSVAPFGGPGALTRASDERQSNSGHCRCRHREPAHRSGPSTTAATDRRGTRGQHHRARRDAGSPEFRPSRRRRAARADCAHLGVGVRRRARDPQPAFARPAAANRVDFTLASARVARDVAGTGGLSTAATETMRTAITLHHSPGITLADGGPARLPAVRRRRGGRRRAAGMEVSAAAPRCSRAAAAAAGLQTGIRRRRQRATARPAVLDNAIPVI